MKLVCIMSVEGYAEKLRRLYAEHHIPVFSETDIQGYHAQETTRADANWFGHGHPPVYSKLTFAFVPADKADALLAAIEAYNREAHQESPLRAFLMNVEKHV